MKICIISIILLYAIVSSKASNVANLDVWNQYSAVFGDKVIHNVSILYKNTNITLT